MDIETTSQQVVVRWLLSNDHTNCVLVFWPLQYTLTAYPYSIPLQRGQLHDITWQKDGK